MLLDTASLLNFTMSDPKSKASEPKVSIGAMHGNVGEIDNPSSTDCLLLLLCPDIGEVVSGFDI